MNQHGNTISHFPDYGKDNGAKCSFFALKCIEAGKSVRIEQADGVQGFKNGGTGEFKTFLASKSRRVII